MGTLDQILNYGNALAEALVIMELKSRYVNVAADERRLQGLADELFSVPFGQHYNPSEEELWAYVSAKKLDWDDARQRAAMRIALAYFPVDEILMAAANRGNKTVALIAGCVIKYENQDRQPPDPLTQIIEDATAGLSARASGVPYILR